MNTGAAHKPPFPDAPLDTACMPCLNLHMPRLIDSATKREARITSSNSLAAYDSRLRSTIDLTSIETEGRKDASLSKFIRRRNLPFQSFDDLCPDAALHFLTFSARHDRAQPTRPSPRQLLNQTASGHGRSRAQDTGSRKDLLLESVVSPKPAVPLLPNRARADQRPTPLFRRPRHQPQVHKRQHAQR